MLLLLRSLWLIGLIQSHPTEIEYNAPLHKPLNIELILAANFGELRPNHFHTGIDIKTQGKEGYPLYSIADGYVSRIKTSSSGYGKVIYINHPQYGITSVYAHCQNFVEPIAAYTRAAQEANAFYEIDINVPALALPVKKGENIALSGNTGSSSGPHLHFEIRETKTENPLNPLLFSFMEIADTRAPHIQTLVIYALSKFGYRIPEKRIELAIKLQNGKYYLTQDTLDLPAHFCSEHGGIGLGLAVYDKYNGANDVCGIYHGVLTLNQDTVHQQIMNRLDFEFNRQINTHKDYDAYNKNRSKIEKYFRTIHNKVPIYDHTKGKGILGLQPDHTYGVGFSISDIAKNNSILSFVIRILPGALRLENTPFDRFDPDYFYPDSTYNIKNKDYQIQISDFCLYEPLKKNIAYKNGQLLFGDANDPVNAAIQISLAIQAVDKFPNDKIVLFHNESKSYFTGTAQNGMFSSSVKTFGTFQLTHDTLAPTLVKKFKVLNTPQTLSRLSWTVKDDRSGLAHYQLFVNGAYHVLEYEHKHSELFSDIKLPAGKHDIQIVVKDAVGNSREEKFVLWQR
jgi:hypothetical protein